MDVGVVAPRVGVAQSPVSPRGPILVMSALSLALGLVYLSGAEGVFPWFLSLSVLTLVAAVLWISKSSGDWVNPMAILVLSAIVRIGLPYLMVLKSQPPPGFGWMAPAFSYWDQGVALACFGLTAILFGWVGVPRRWCSGAARRFGALSKRFEVDRSVARVAIFFMAAGLLLIAIFLSINYSSPVSAVQSGVIHTETRVDGTSRYNFLAGGLLTYGSAALTVYLLLQKRKPLLVGLLPVIFGSAAFSIFGGRVVALSPLAIGFLAAWYRKRRARVGVMKALFVYGALLVIATIYASFVLAYRFEGGLSGGLQAVSLSGLVEYASFSVWYESGFLHPFALASYFGPGVLDWSVFVGVGGFVTEVFMGMEGVRPGTYMVEELLHPPNPWSLHSGVIVDLYMGLGLIGTLVGCILFGSSLRLLFEGFKANRGSAIVVLLYAALFWHLIWVFYEAVIALFTVFVGLGFIGLLLLFARLIRPATQRR